MRRAERAARHATQEGERLRRLVDGGRLTWDDVLLAAYVGHPGALAACKGRRPLPPGGSVWSRSRTVSRRLFSAPATRSSLFAEDEWRDHEDISRIGDWAYGFGRWGKAVQLRAALAAAEQALRKFEGKFPRDSGPRRALAAAAAVLERGRRVKPRPVLAACRAALASAQKAARAEGFDHAIMPGRCAAYDAACAANQAAKLAHLILTVRIPSDELAARLAAVPFAFVTSRAVRYAAGAASSPRVAAAVRKSIVKESLKGGGR